MTDKTFAELYCERHGIDLDQYAQEVMKRSLYPHARLLAGLVRALWPEHFTADLDFVRSVGRLRRFREFAYESEEFAHHPANRGFWRLTANVRVSSRALRRIVRFTLHPELESPADDDHTTAPFRTRGATKPEAASRNKNSREASA
jgi:hypothetical protein